MERRPSMSKGSVLETNVHGLKRYIPKPIRRQIRQECGFGCVICGLAIAQYEHIDPPFASAMTHDPRKMALLCAGCHDRVTRGHLSKQTVLEARAAPRTFARGFARNAFDFKHPFELYIGDSHLRDVRCVVKRGSDEWFVIEPAEAPEAPPRLSAKFFGPNGHVELEIAENEWRCASGVWDLKVEGPVIELRTQPREIMLRLKARPPYGLEIERLRMKYHDSGILIEADGSVCLTLRGTEVRMTGSDIVRADAVFNLA